MIGEPSLKEYINICYQWSAVSQLSIKACLITVITEDVLPLVKILDFVKDVWNDEISK